MSSTPRVHLKLCYNKLSKTGVLKGWQKNAIIEYLRKENIIIGMPGLISESCVLIPDDRLFLQSMPQDHQLMYLQATSQVQLAFCS